MQVLQIFFDPPFSLGQPNFFGKPQYPHHHYLIQMSKSKST